MRKILSVITAATGNRVKIGDAEIEHALQKHFPIPKIKLLEVVEQVLTDPSFVLEDKSSDEKQYYLFYRLNETRYLVAIVKINEDGAFFSAVYPTGNQPRNSHKKLKKVKL